MIETECPYCGIEYHLRPELGGQIVRCQACQKSFEVPTLDDDDEEDEEDLEDIHSIETSPVARSGQRFSASAPARRGSSEIDSHGFLVHHEEEEEEDDPDEEEDDEDARMMQEAAERGATYLYQPREFNTGAGLVLPERREVDANPIPKEILWGFIFLFVVGGGAFLMIHYASKIRANLALNGLPAEIQAEFEQNDRPLGSPAPESVRRYIALTVRGTLKHQEMMRKMTAILNQAADVMARIQDQQSAESNRGDLENAMAQLEQLKSEYRHLFNPNQKEDQQIARATGADLIKAVDRIAAHARRIASYSDDPAIRIKMMTMDRGIAELKRRYGGDFSSIDDPYAYVEVRVAGLKNTAERDYIHELLVEMATPKNQLRSTSTLAATRYAFWPVSSPSVFARKITFGKVIYRTGNEIWVVADPIDPEILKERAAISREERYREREQRDKNLAEAKAAEAATTAAVASNKPETPKEPEIPAEADEITRSLIILTKSPTQFKRRSAAQTLLKADLTGREDEVLEELRLVLSDADPFILEDTLAIIRLCKSPLRIQILADHLNSEINRDRIITALGETEDPAAIEPLVNVMRFDPKGLSDRCLIKFGVTSEPAVIPLLASGDASIRRRACNILAEIGTDESLKAFKKLPADFDLGVRAAAKNAMRAIDNRTRLSTDPDKTPEKPKK